MHKQKKAFTLVELIVVIVILAILGSIAFISLQDYSKSSRNSVRITDIGLIKQSLGIFEVENGKYPIPKTYQEITYNGGLLWHQGTFDEQVRGNLDNLSKKPVDPFFELEYDYSVINNRTKYQIAAVMEGGLFTDNQFISDTYAADYGNIEAYVTGNYDLFTVKSQSGSNCYLLPIPTLFVNNPSNTGALSIAQDHFFVLDSGTNISTNYGSKITPSGTSTPFVLQEVLNTCSVNTIDELNLFISKLSVIFQQLNYTGNYSEIIYDFAAPTFKVGMIENLLSNGISVNSELSNKALNPSESNIYNDTFTSTNGTELVGGYTNDTLGTWTNTGALVSSSYIISGNILQKNDTSDGVIFPVPVLPITSRDRSLILNTTNFAGGEIMLYTSYYDNDNYFGVSIDSSGYEIRNYVGGVQSAPYPLIASESIGNNSLVEFIIAENNFKLLINSIEKENSIDPAADMDGDLGIKIGNNGGQIDNFNLIYK